MDDANPSPVPYSERPGSECGVPDCHDPWSVALFAGDVNLRIREAFFRLSPGETETIRMCWKHYRVIHRKDGITLGYRMVKGRVQRYVKEVHY